MIFKIDGTDILKYVASDGLKYTRSDLDGPNAGRTLDGVMHRDRVASKIRWDVTCHPLQEEDLAVVLSLIQPEFVTVEYTDLQTRQVVSKTMYSNNVPTKLAFAYKDGAWWTALTFPLIEK